MGENTEVNLDTILNHQHNENDDVPENIHNKNIKELEKIYKNNTEDFITRYGITNKIKIIENNIKVDKRKLRKSIASHGAAREKWKQVIYDNQKFEDKYKFYFILSTLHFLILILLFMGFLNIINNFIITLGIFILYLLIIGVFVVKMDMNKYRNNFNYNEYDIKYDPTGVCNVKEQDVTEQQETENKEDILSTLTN
jgi:hypothetical protein